MSSSATRLTRAGSLRLIGASLMALPVLVGASGQQVAVSGRVTLLERENKAATDLAQAVVWLEPAQAGAGVAGRDTVRMVTADKEFRPLVAVLLRGGSVTFPNTDAFDHNVFSLSQEAPFDLGLYGRGPAKTVQFTKPGIVRVYCNVHPQMSAFVVVRDTPWYTQPRADGSFTIQGVPPGDYTVHAWHERAGPFGAQPITIGAAGAVALDLKLDARGYKFVQHLNKFGQPYARRGRRY